MLALEFLHFHTKTFPLLPFPQIFNILILFSFLFVLRTINAGCNLRKLHHKYCASGRVGLSLRLVSHLSLFSLLFLLIRLETYDIISVKNYYYILSFFLFTFFSNVQKSHSTCYFSVFLYFLHKLAQERNDKNQEF